MGGGDALGLHADLKGCRVQLSGSCRERPGNVERRGSRGSRGRYGTCGAAALIDMHGGASGAEGEGGPSAKEMEGYRSMVMIKGGRGYLHTGCVLGAGSESGPLESLARESNFFLEFTFLGKYFFYSTLNRANKQDAIL